MSALRRLSHSRPRTWKRKRCKACPTAQYALAIIRRAVDSGELYEGEHTATHWVITTQAPAHD